MFLRSKSRLTRNPIRSRHYFHKYETDTEKNQFRRYEIIHFCNIKTNFVLKFSQTDS